MPPSPLGSGPMLSLRQCFVVVLIARSHGIFGSLQNVILSGTGSSGPVGEENPSLDDLRFHLDSSLPFLRLSLK